MSTLLKDLPKSELPRERLLYYGVENLNNEELLALLLRTGTKELSAKGLAEEILKNFGSIEELKAANIRQLSKIKGMGIAKSTTILSAIELGKRVYHLSRPIEKLQIKSADVAIKYFANIISEEKQENFMAIYLDNQHQYISHKILFKGTNNKSLVEPKEVFREALLLSSNSIIIMHNHPSGVVKPSISDDTLTRQMVEVGGLMGIQVLDHIIVGENNYFSYIEEGKLRFE